MRSIPVVDETSIAIARSYDGIADWLLLDSYESGDRQIGALGVTHNWELAAHYRKRAHPNDHRRGTGTRERPGGYSSRAPSRCRFENKNR